jgi:mRNA interferase MazF
MKGLGDGIGSEQSGERPVCVVSNNIGNFYSPTVIVAYVTSRVFKNQMPTHVKVDENLIMCEQIKTVDKGRLANWVTTLSPQDLQKVDKALRLSFDI